MRVPGLLTLSRRDLGLAGLAVLLTVLPVIAGFASGAEAADPASTGSTPTEMSDLAEARGGPVTVADTPIGQVPDSMDDALTRLDSDLADLARVQYEVGDSGPVGIANGGAIPLGGGLEAQLTVSPYPPNDFDVDVAVQLTLDDRPLTDALVETTWDMVFMYHGPFETEMAHAGDGRYAASYDFFMFGPWELLASVELPDRDTTEFAVSIYVWPTG